MITKTVSQTAAPKPTLVRSQIELGELSLDEQEPMCLAIFGGPGGGKSRLAGTAPGGIGLLAMENKSKQTVLTVANELGTKVYGPTVNSKAISLIRTSNQLQLSKMPKSCIVVGSDAYKGYTPGQIQDVMQRKSDEITVHSDPPACCQRHYFRWHVERVKFCGYQMLDDDRIKTIVIDPFGTFVDDVSQANYGVTGVIDPKEFGFAPREDMINEIRAFLNNMTAKNLILTHHQKEVWKDNKPTNRMQADGKFSKIGHYATVMLEMRREERKLPGGVEVTWKAVVQDCQANATLIGQEVLEGEAISFAALAMLVYPESKIETWL
jgi:hypothetical protein